MSDITSEFNSAAAGPSGEAASVSGGTAPHGPHGPAGAAASRHFEYETASSLAHDQQAPASQVFQSELHPNIGIASAEAELETLEGGRVKPAPRHDLNPRQPLKKIVDSKIERQREARISALKAYLEFKQEEAAHKFRHDHGEELEFGI